MLPLNGNAGDKQQIGSATAPAYVAIIVTIGRKWPRVIYDDLK